MKFIDNFFFSRKIRSLIKSGRDLNVESFKGTGLLHYAVSAGMKNELQILIDNKINLNSTATPLELTSLHMLSFGNSKNTYIADMLIAAGADMESGNSKGETPLHIASSLKGNSYVFQKLISAGADINALDNEKEIPMHKAAYWGNYNAALRLLENGSKLNVKNIDGMTPLHLCVFFCQTHVMRLLLEKGADRKIKNSNNETALAIAQNYILPDERARVVMISLLDEKAEGKPGEIITSIENVSMIRPYTRFINEMPDKAGPYILRGEVYMQAGVPKLALNDFNKAIELEPENGKAHMYRGAVYASTGDIKSARVEGDRALELGEKDAGEFIRKLEML